MKSLILLMLVFSLTAMDDVTPPSVTHTVPSADSQGIDPALGEIRVSFDEKMMPGSWSWATRGVDAFPEITGSPRWEADQRTAVLPVSLKPGVTYEIMINSPKHRNFKDAAGNPAVPYALRFSTRGQGS
ncbi:MAG: Ig-like domain-containing protein [Pseudomonadota bacterium]